MHFFHLRLSFQHAICQVGIIINNKKEIGKTKMFLQRVCTFFKFFNSPSEAIFDFWKKKWEFPSKNVKMISLGGRKN